ncbi:hypothetical protein HDU91_006218, partial [Kappamyces sp. JEL0680]
MGLAASNSIRSHAYSRYLHKVGPDDGGRRAATSESTQTSCDIDEDLKQLDTEVDGDKRDAGQWDQLAEARWSTASSQTEAVDGGIDYESQQACFIENMKLEQQVRDANHLITLLQAQ